MSLGITLVPETQQPIGVARFNRQAQLIPGFSDYPTGGYPISGSQLGIGNLWGATLLNGNGASAAYGVTFVLSTYPTTPAPNPTLFMKVTSAGVEVSASANLAACTWIAEFMAAAE
jgi:hypothetical protein